MSVTMSTPLAHAGQIYKCTASDGSVAFSNLACPPHMAISTFTAKPNFIAVWDVRGQISLKQEHTNDGTHGATEGNYIGAAAAWGIGQREPADQMGQVSGARTRLRGDAVPSADPTLAERIREARDTDAQRRALRLRAGSSDKP
jgi:hypothetical protein